MRWAARLWPLFAVVVLLAAVAVLAQLGHVTIHSVPPNPHPQGNSATSDAATPVPLPTQVYPTVDALAKSDRTARWIVAVLVCLAGIGLLSALVLGAVTLIQTWRPFGKRRGRLGPSADTTAASLGRRHDVIAAVDASLSALAAGGGDARAAVIACWVRLEEVAALAGTPRTAGDTPSDLVGRLLTTQQVSRAALTELADLYRTARYSTWDIDEAMRSRAHATLGRLRDELGRSHPTALAAASTVPSGGPAGQQPSGPRPGARS